MLIHRQGGLAYRGDMSGSISQVLHQWADNPAMGPFRDVDVYRHEDEDGGEPWWGAAGGLENSSVGVDFDSTQDLAELINAVHDETIALSRKWPDLQVRWFEGRQPATDSLPRHKRRASLSLRASTEWSARQCALHS